MEHKHKLLATASSQAQVACPESVIDRFSNLPDEVAHQILSFFDFKKLIQVGSLSKRFRGLSLSSLSLDFSSSYSNEQEQLNMLNSFDRFLVHRGANKLQNFCIRLVLRSRFHDEMFRVITWIHIAARCNVEVIDLQLRILKIDMDMLELPSCIVLCGSLRSLSYTTLKVPSFFCSTNLEHVSLSNVRIDEEFSKWISSSCKCIKQLQLPNVRTEDITLESSSLESFRFVPHYSHSYHLNISCEKLEDIHIEWGFSERGSRSLNIFAPNLKYLKWVGNLLKHQNLGKLMYLEKAEIFLERTVDTDDMDNAIEFLCAICRVLFKEGSMPAQFDNISYLGMHIQSLSDDLVPAMVSLLRGMPNLNTLLIDSDTSLLFLKPKACGCNRKYWKSQNLNFTDQLKEVTIELSNGFNGMELARLDLYYYICTLEGSFEA